MESRFELAKLQYGKQKYEEAIEGCLQMIKMDKNWNKKAAYNLVMEIFKMLGDKHELVPEARKRLAKLLF